MSPFEAYKLFMAVKMHFTQPNYDFHKYHGKVNANLDSFNKRRDKFHFAKLARHKDPLGYLVSVFISGNFNGWVGDLFSEQNEQGYTDYLARQQSLSYVFSRDLETVSENFVSRFKVKDGQHPEILVLFRRGVISIETLCILNDVLKFFPIWDTRIDDTVLWPAIRDRCVKYCTFIRYDHKKIKSMIKELIDV
jgi:hypothetical protein